MSRNETLRTLDSVGMGWLANLPEITLSRVSSEIETAAERLAKAQAAVKAAKADLRNAKARAERKVAEHYTALEIMTAKANPTPIDD